MRQVPLLFPFGLALFFSLFGTAFLPNVHLLAFSPFFALLYNRKSFIAALWIAALCGLSIDLLSSNLRLGLHALTACLTTLVLYQQKKHFFEDKPLALSLFTLLISIVFTLIQLLVISIFERALPFSGKQLLTDCLIMPLFDAVYAYLWFSCPMMLYLHIKKVGWRAFRDKLLGYFKTTKVDVKE